MVVFKNALCIVILRFKNDSKAIQLETLTAFTVLKICSRRDNKIWATHIFFCWRLKTGQFWVTFKTEDLKTQFLIFKDLNTALFCHLHRRYFRPEIQKYAFICTIEVEDGVSKMCHSNHRLWRGIDADSPSRAARKSILVWFRIMK